MKYEIYHAQHITLVYQLFVVRVITPILSNDNSFHTVSVYDKPYQVVINTGLTIYNTGDS